MLRHLSFPASVQQPFDVACPKFGQFPTRVSVVHLPRALIVVVGVSNGVVQ